MRAATSHSHCCRDVTTCPRQGPPEPKIKMRCAPEVLPRHLPNLDRFVVVAAHLPSPPPSVPRQVPLVVRLVPVE